MNIKELAGQLGMTEKAMGDRIVNELVKSVMERRTMDEDDEYGYGRSSEFAELVRRQVQEEITLAVAVIAEEAVKPNLKTYLDDLMVERTNRYGEKQGEPFTFVEYLLSECDKWVNEEVNIGGETRAAQRYPRDFEGKMSRLKYMIHEHLDCNIRDIVNDALKDINDTILTGIEDAVKEQLLDASEKLKVSVKTG